jgi:ADP-ribose diphosphatase
MSEHEKRLEVHRIYTGRVINLDLDRIELPNGAVAELEIIRHPGASAIVPILGDWTVADPTIVLIRQFRHAADGYLYEVPAGRLNDGENPAECAMRELAEETGYRAGRVERLFSMFTTPGFTDERIHVFRAVDLREGASAREADEILDLQPMPLSRAVELIERGEIEDAKTALSLLFVARFRGRAPG